MIVLLLGQKSNADMYLDLGYGMSKPFAQSYGKDFFGGLVAGFRYDIEYKDSKLVEFGLGYVQRGGKDKFMVSTLQGEVLDNGWSVFQYDYLRIPVVLKFRNPPPKVVRVAFFIGPRLDIRLNYKQHLELKNSDLQGYGGWAICFPAEDWLNWVVFGATTGMEFEPFFKFLFGPSLRAGRVRRRTTHLETRPGRGSAAWGGRWARLATRD
jgi:hypothetical protein